MPIPLPKSLSPAVAVLAGGLTAALLDIVYAFTVFGLTHGTSPARILQSIASGVLGKAAYQGGLGAAALGAALHVGIALVMAVVYGIAARALPMLNRRPWLWGALYGIGCYVVMNYVVLALRFGPRPLPPLSLLLGGLAIHVLGVGLPIALFATRAAHTARAPAPAVAPQPFA